MMRVRVASEDEVQRSGGEREDGLGGCGYRGPVLMIPCEFTHMSYQLLFDTRESRANRSAREDSPP